MRVLCLSYRRLLLGMLLFCALVAGCSRRHYRVRADRDSYELLGEFTAGTPWQLPEQYSVYPAPNSRLADPTDADCPLLPSPGPVLHTGAASTSLHSGTMTG